MRPRPGVLRVSARELLVSLVVMIIATPFLQNLRDGNFIEGVLLTLVLLSGMLAVGGRRSTLLIAMLLVTPAIVSRWIGHYRPGWIPREFVLASVLLFVGFVVAHLLSFVLRVRRVNSEVLCAGVAGYLMLGMFWSLTYLLVSEVVAGSFALGAGGLPIGSLDSFEAFYFSLSTLTTVGYGDIVPQSRVAKTLAMMEAAAGVFYLAILIARLVSLYSSTLAADRAEADGPMARRGP